MGLSQRMRTRACLCNSRHSSWAHHEASVHQESCKQWTKHVLDLIHRLAEVIRFLCGNSNSKKRPYCCCSCAPQQTLRQEARLQDRHCRRFNKLQGGLHTCARDDGTPWAEKQQGHWRPNSVPNCHATDLDALHQWTSCQVFGF